MTAAPVHLAGERLMLDPSGALLWPAAGMLVVSDLHLEKGSSYARRGMLLPPWDTHATLDRLSILLRRYQPPIVVALGDSFHDKDAASRLPPHRAGAIERDHSGASLHLGIGKSRPASGDRDRGRLDRGIRHSPARVSTSRASGREWGDQWTLAPEGRGAGTRRQRQPPLFHR